MLTAFGVSALTFMMLMYAVESRRSGFVLAFACGCALASLYGFLSGAWVFGVVEAIWALVALRRFATRIASPPTNRQVRTVAVTGGAESGSRCITREPT